MKVASAKHLNLGHCNVVKRAVRLHPQREYVGAHHKPGNDRSQRVTRRHRQFHRLHRMHRLHPRLLHPLMERREKDVHNRWVRAQRDTGATAKCPSTSSRTHSVRRGLSQAETFPLKSTEVQHSLECQIQRRRHPKRVQKLPRALGLVPALAPGNVLGLHCAWDHTHYRRQGAQSHDVEGGEVDL